jgi:hypothetical protein
MTPSACSSCQLHRLSMPPRRPVRHFDFYKHFIGKASPGSCSAAVLVSVITADRHDHSNSTESVKQAAAGTQGLVIGTATIGPNIIYKIIDILASTIKRSSPIPVAAESKSWVCDRWDCGFE